MFCIVVYVKSYVTSKQKELQKYKRKFLTNIEVVLHPYLRKKKRLKVSDKLAKAVVYRKLWSNGELNNGRMVQALL